MKELIPEKDPETGLECKNAEIYFTQQNLSDKFMEDGNKGIRRYLRNIKCLFLFLYFKHMALALAISEFQMPALIVTHEMQSRE